MKTLAALLGLIITGMISENKQVETVSVTVTVENILNDNGLLLAGLHDQETFMKGPGLKRIKEDARKGHIKLTFEDVKPGTYAIMLLHDENSNLRMDFDSNGLPLEHYSTSGSTNMYGPPVFENAKFEVGNKDLEMLLRF